MRDAANKIEVPRVQLVHIVGGKFLMGSPDDEQGRDRNEGPQHEVEVPSFYLARTPVTNAQYAEFLKASSTVELPELWMKEEFNQPHQPVVGVSWDEASAYCAWAGLQLPTEAQWEYACRAGTTTRYYGGDDEADLDRAAWFGGNSEGRLHDVAGKEPNAFGLHDMHGNVWEWCADRWVGGGYDAAQWEPADGVGTRTGDYMLRVLRGGSFGSYARLARSAVRYGDECVGRNRFVGFRPAKSEA